MTDSKLDKYKVDRLFLLIGENPLPNYVAAHLLLNKGGSVYLVHTTGTSEQAKQLAKILRSDDSLNCSSTELVSLDNYEADSFQIQTRIRSKAKPLTGSLGLNYTGGTKAMAVHAYQAIQELRKGDPVYSYLDSRQLEMCIDRPDGDRIRIAIKPDTLQISLEKLFQIHRLELKNTHTSKALFPNLTLRIAQNYDLWHSWLQKNLSPQARKGDGKGEWKSGTDLKKVSLSLTELPSVIQAAFQEYNLIDSSRHLLLQDFLQQGNFKELTGFKWLEGMWLEHYVLKSVAEISKKCLINDYGLNFEIPITGTKDGFEFDVAFMRGYQLFAISCTTSKRRSLCKSKLFEASIRAQQMGGSEARVALMCCFGDPESLKSELASLLGENQVTVFGQEHLDDLPKAISQWIKDQGGKS
jgi:hypothetical protein